MARARVEQQQPAATGTTLIVMVGLGIACLLFMAFLNVVKSGNLLNESNLLYAALIFYAGAGALYLGFGVTGTDSYVRFASIATWVGVVLMQLLRTDVHPLVPALQSTWLHVHVTLAMLAYAACALSFALALMFLIQDKMPNETF